MAEIHWINQRGYCDGPHPEKCNGKWRYPKGRTAIRRFIKQNGVINYELVCTTPGCRFVSSPIPNAAGAILLGKLTELKTRYAAQVSVCCYDGCESTAIEWHHFAPYNTFGEEANKFPVQPLCRDHHRYWHEKMDGYQWRRQGQW